MKKSISNFSNISQIFLIAILLPNFAYAKGYDNSMADKPELVSDVKEDSNIDDQESGDAAVQYPNFGGEVDPKYKVSRITSGGKSREIGYSTSLAYSFELQNNLTLVPFIELIKIDNFGGKSNYNDFNSILALSAKYNNWRASILGSRRSAKQSSHNIKIHDNQLQFSVGYQFSERLGLDLSAMDLKEDHVSGFVVGAMVKYAYKF